VEKWRLRVEKLRRRLRKVYLGKWRKLA